MDKINKYINKKKFIYYEKIKLSISYFDIRKVFLNYKNTLKLNKNEKELELIEPFICSNVNSSYYHLVVIYKSNTSHVMILFNDNEKEDSECHIVELKKVNFNFSKFNNGFYNIFVYH